MYNINYIDGLITKEKYGSAFVRFLKILNFFVHLGIIGILVLSVFAYMDIENYNRKIDNTKQDIENKRTTNKISEIEKEWETYYYKLCAVKTQVENHTNYAFVFRDLGLYLPSDNSILDLSFDKNMSTVYMTISKGVLNTLTSFYDYTNTLVPAFEKSNYLRQDLSIQDLEVRKINKVELKALKVQIPLNSRK